MNRTAMRTILASLAFLLLSPAASAQLFRAYLSIEGSDSNPCTLPAPCRLLPAALSAVSAGGEIWMLDSANYNAGLVHITKSVTILAVPGAVGSVVATAANAAILLDTAGVEVALRNLVITRNVNSPGTHGVVVFNGAGLIIEKCVFANLPGNAVEVATPAKVYISDTVIRGSGISGVRLRGGPQVAISNTQLLGNTGTAIFLQGDVTTAGTLTTLHVSDSIVSGNAEGVNVSSNATGAQLAASVVRSTIADNLYGAIAQTSSGGAAILTLSANLIVRNTTTGVLQGGSAIVESAGNNTVRQNGSDSSGTITAVSQL